MLNFVCMQPTQVPNEKAHGGDTVETAAEEVDPTTTGGEGPDDDRLVERLVFRGEGVPFSVISAQAPQSWVAGLISLEVGGTQLGDAGLGTIVKSLTPWLRELGAAGDLVGVTL